MATTREATPILPLTSVRFLAALYIMLLHSVLWTHHIETVTWVGRFLRTGYTAVGFFFVLSGYILAEVYMGSERAWSRRAFWTSRFARVYPLLFFSLLLGPEIDSAHPCCARMARGSQRRTRLWH